MAESFNKASFFTTSSLKALGQNPARTLFAFLGISLGITSLVFIVAAIEGSNSKARHIIEMMGANTIFIRSGFGKRANIHHLRYKLDITDFKDLRRIEGVKTAAYLLVKMERIASASNARESMVMGAMSTFLETFDYRVNRGIAFRPTDYRSFAKVCIIGPELARFFFGAANPLGKFLRVNRTSFRIIGIYRSKGRLPNGMSLDDRLILPIETYRKFIEPEYKKVLGIELKVAPGADYQHIVEEARSILLRRHAKEDFVMITPEMVRKFLNVFNMTLSIYLGLASLVALFVGGFVLSNIFFINVKVRAWEIGIRRALGANRRTIMAQFLAESVAIALAGAIAGTCAGFLSIYLVMPMLGIPKVYPMKSLVIALLFATATGLVAAIMPAKKAADYRPVEALRSRL